MKGKTKKLLLFMPTVNQKPEKLLAKTEEILNLKILLERRKMGLRVLVACDGSKPEFNTLETLQQMKDKLGDIFEFTCYPENVGKTVTVVNGLKKLMEGSGPDDLIGCLDDNEHFFLDALDLIDRIDEGYLGAIGTISYPSDILNNIDRHAMPAVGAIESQIMNLKGSLCIYASGYWIQHTEIVRVALKIYPLYQNMFREMFPNEIIKIPKWGTPTLFQELMTWAIRTQEPWVNTPEEYRRLAVCYLPCKEIPAMTPLGRSLNKALNQLRALVLNGLVLDELMGRERNKKITLPA
ncbi:MAG: hypothetical protein NT136_03915 [Candidatus Moranbacteria bacterium]|nr:hypothetical protein [Candidatus Moranbacteria bacterium]